MSGDNFPNYKPADHGPTRYNGHGQTRMEGIVRSYVADRRFGFIDGEDGKSYFFHADAFVDPNDKTEELDGAILAFQPTATPKGLAAKRLSLVRDRAEIWEPLEEFLVSRDERPRRGEIMAIGTRLTVQGPGSLDDFRLEIRRIAAAMGANALLGFQYTKGAGQTGNYRFTIHHFSGTPALVMLKRPKSDLSLQAISDRRLEALQHAFLEGSQDYENHLEWVDRTARRRRRVKAIFLSLLLLGLIAEIVNGLSAGAALSAAIFVSLLLAVIPTAPDPTWPRLGGKARPKRWKLRWGKSHR